MRPAMLLRCAAENMYIRPRRKLTGSQALELMTRPPTYYETLGIGPGATPDQVRDAYVRLMKRHHPDMLSAADGSGRADVAPLLNRCYAVLRDPQSRAWYDAQLAGRPDAGTPVWSNARAMVAYKGSDRHRFRLWLVAAAMLGAIALSQLWTGLQAGQWLQQSGGIGQPALATAGTIAPAAADRSEILRATQRAMSASPGEAEVMSARCFAALRTKRSRRTEDLCVVFDNAYIYWHRNARAELILPSYFDDALVRIRHLNAVAGSGDDPQARLAALRDRTFRVLLAQIKTPPVAQFPAGAPRQEPKPAPPLPELGQSSADLAIHN